MTRQPSMTAAFLGGARTVTGSKTLIETSGSRLLVDCGLFQGRKELRLANWKPFPVEPESIDAVAVTHAHIDHCGALPRLCKLGYRGPIYATPGTCDLAGIVLPDSAHLQEEDANYANRKGYSKHHPAEPLYTAANAAQALDLMRPVPYATSIEPVPGVTATWQRAGHILGAASLRITTPETSILFSGDLGRPVHPLLVPPDPPDGADVVVIESTYGDREHVDTDVEAVLGEAIRGAVDRGGVVVIPAFAVDRTEVVLWHLDQLVERGEIPSVPVVLDSPMARTALELYRTEVGQRSPEFRPELFGRTLFGALDLTVTTSVEDSKALNTRDGPLVIISASGMATGGRVVHHLASRLGDDRNAVLLVGFQAPGTRGDRLREGAKTLRMFGREHPVRARIVSVDLSTHADRSELLDWIGAARQVRTVIVNHGEPQAAFSLAAVIEHEFGLETIVPQPGQRVGLAGPER
jgi:metallo-beta-lactamase family protein